MGIASPPARNFNPGAPHPTADLGNAHQLVPLGRVNHPPAGVPVSHEANALHLPSATHEVQTTSQNQIFS